jgi:hypothetical protein
MTDLRKASPGTISHGTLKTEDLLGSFASELEHNVQRNAEAWCSDEGWCVRNRLLNLVNRAREYDIGPTGGKLLRSAREELAVDLVSELIDELQAFAPKDHYFGAHSGDGSDFGYWMSEEAPDGDDAR